MENGRFFPTEKKFRDKVSLDALDSKSSAVKTKNTIVVDSKKITKLNSTLPLLMKNCVILLILLALLNGPISPQIQFVPTKSVSIN